MNSCNVSNIYRTFTAIIAQRHDSHLEGGKLRPREVYMIYPWSPNKDVEEPYKLRVKAHQLLTTNLDTFYKASPKLQQVTENAWDDALTPTWESINCNWYHSGSISWSQAEDTGLSPHLNLSLNIKLLLSTLPDP